MALDIAAELCLSAMAASLVLTEEAAQTLMQEMSVSPFSEAALALHLLLTKNPAHFLRQQAMTALGSKFCRLCSVICVSEIMHCANLTASCRFSCMGSLLHGQ